MILHSATVNADKASLRRAAYIKQRQTLPLRVCVFSPKESTLEEVNLPERIFPFLDRQEIELTLLTNDPWAKQTEVPGMPYVIAESNRRKMRLIRKLLEKMSGGSWFTSALATFAVGLCEANIIEALKACDPDVIVCSDAQWRTPLSALLAKRDLPWLCMTSTDSVAEIDRAWRKYDRSAKVSVVLPTYNGSTYLTQSIHSCLSQTHENIELLIVDDGSNQDIEGIAKGYKDTRIRYFRHPKNLGLPTALNTGFKYCTGEYLTWTSDDNFYVESAIEQMVRFIQTYPGTEFVYAENYIIDERVGSSTPRIRRIEPPESLKIRNEIGACFLYSRKVRETVGEYNPKLFLAEDYDYWIRVARHFRMQRLFRPLYHYRFHDASLTSQHSQAEISEVNKLMRQGHTVR